MISQIYCFFYKKQEENKVINIYYAPKALLHTSAIMLSLYVHTAKA